MPNKHGFNELGTTRSCIEDKCSFTGEIWNMPEDKQIAHFLEHFREAQIVEGRDIIYTVEGEMRTQPCRVCGNEFSQPRRRGRPKLTCEVCSG